MLFMSREQSTPLGRFRRQLQAELDADREGTAFQKLSKAMGEGFEVLSLILPEEDEREA
jgi:hypothetical protein